MGGVTADAAQKTQRDLILGLLIRAAGGWVPLTAILDLRVSQYSARLHELRALGFHIENKTARVNGATHSWFRLASGPGVMAKAAPVPVTDPGRLKLGKDVIEQGRGENPDNNNLPLFPGGLRERHRDDG
jgi:hypothetical protein